MWIEKNGPTFRIRDLVAGKKVTVRAGFPNKTVAKNAMKVLEGDKLRGDYIDPRAGQITLTAWIELWWPSHQIKLKPTSVKSEGARIRNHILPWLGEYTLADLNPMIIKSWVAQLLVGDEETERDALAPKTIRNIHGLMYAILQEAVLQKLIKTNPCQRTGLPRVEHKEMRFLTEVEISRLVVAMPPHWRPLVVLLVATGMRWAECAGLKVKHIDVLARTLRIEESLHELAAGQDLVTTGPKTERSRRTVTYPRWVAEMLIPLVVERDREAYVFQGPYGGAVRYRKFWRLYVRHAAKAGLEGLRIHDLRHTHAAHLIAGRVPLTGVQRRLGHSSITVTSDLYGHLLPVVDENIITAVEVSLSKIDFRGLVGETAPEYPAGTSTIEPEQAGQAA